MAAELVQRERSRESVLVRYDTTFKVNRHAIIFQCARALSKQLHSFVRQHDRLDTERPAAQEVHGGASLLKRKGEFPAPLEHDYPLSSEASRYYKSGKSFLYRRLPFRFASVVNRILVAFVPVVVLFVPAMRLLPTLLSLRVKLRIYRWYRALLALERDLQFGPPEHRPELLERLDHIEREVNKMKVPASFADQFYTLRGSIGFVRERVANAAPPKPVNAI